MKYYFVSDLHGCPLFVLTHYLNQTGFAPDRDFLVVVGDVVDRDLYSMELIKFLLSLPHTIFIWGNHELRTKAILDRAVKATYIDAGNGVRQTLHSIAGLKPNEKLKNIWYYIYELIPNSETAQANLALFREYCSKCVWAVEWPDLIVTHAWLPVVEYFGNRDQMKRMSLMPYTLPTSKYYWKEATWADPIPLLKADLLPKKPMLVGHYWAADVRARFEQHKLLEDAIKDGTVDFSPFTYKDVTFIDSATPFSCMVNVVVKEFDVNPFVYKTKEGMLVEKEEFHVQ